MNDFYNFVKQVKRSQTPRLRCQSIVRTAVVFLLCLVAVSLPGNGQSNPRTTVNHTKEIVMTPEEMCNIASTCLDREQDSEAFYWYQKAAEQGYVEAQHKLALLYLYGVGVDNDDSKAAEWLNKAAVQGYAPAQCDLAFCYREGYGVTQSYTNSLYWYRQSAAQGCSGAQCGLGYCYEKGYGVTQSWTEAVAWYRKAAEQNDPNAQFKLGECYENGTGVTQSMSAALKWYRLAAAQGIEWAEDAVKRLESDGFE